MFDYYLNNAQFNVMEKITTKILQGDRIEHPDYIKEKKLKIDFRYYYDHQIMKPVSQIFSLVMKRPGSITRDILRKDTNRRKGAQEITKWLQLSTESK